MIVLSIDPGTNGGSTLIDYQGTTPVDILGAWSWTECQQDLKRAWRVEESNGRTAILHSLHDVGVYIESRASMISSAWVLVVEGLFVPERKPKEKLSTWKGKASRCLTLAESAALVMGPLLARATGDTLRPVASRWRGKVLRLPGGVGADAAEAYAVKAADAVGAGLGTLRQNPHVCEALCIGVFGAWMTERP